MDWVVVRPKKLLELQAGGEGLTAAGAVLAEEALLAPRVGRRDDAVATPEHLRGEKVAEGRECHRRAVPAGRHELRRALPPSAPRIEARMWPEADMVRRREPLELATRLVSAFCSSSGDRLTAHTSPMVMMSLVTLNTAPCGRKDLWLRMLTRSKISYMSMAVLQLSSARASRSGVDELRGMLFLKG